MTQRSRVTSIYTSINMHEEILSSEQKDLLPLVKSFSDKFGLVGGTAIALHLGHRRSIDFDLFSFEEFDSSKIKRKIKTQAVIDKTLRDESSQYTLIINGVHFTFFQYPYPIVYSVPVERWIHIPDLLTLAAMKAFALAHRAKWKDYIDLYFILKDYHSLGEIGAKGKELFAGEFNEKIFRTQLSYFDDVNYTEEVTYLPGFEIEDNIVKEALTKFSIQ